VSRSGEGFCDLLTFSLVIIWGTDIEWLTPVSTVGFDPLTMLKSVLQFVPEDVNVWIWTAWKWSIQPDNITGRNTDSNLVSYTGTIELVREPFLGKWFRLSHPEISAINGHFTAMIVASFKTIFPLNLSHERSKETVLVNNQSLVMASTSDFRTYHIVIHAGNCFNHVPNPFPNGLFICHKECGQYSFHAIVLQEMKCPKKVLRRGATRH
jgi:hypothetical protein